MALHQSPAGPPFVSPACVDHSPRRTRVKFCGLVRPGDVDRAVALGVDAVGFVFYPRSPRAVDAEAALALRRRLPSFVQAVGLFVNATVPHVQAVRAQVGLDIVQLHGDETPDDLAAIGGTCWKAVRVGPQTDVAQQLQHFGPVAEFCLLDSLSAAYGGTGTGFDWAQVPAHAGRQIILAGGLGPDNVGAGIHRLAPFAVDVSSAVQGSDPRTKDPVRMARFMAAVQAADQTHPTR